MSRRSMLGGLFIQIALCGLVAHAQHELKRTITVDPSGTADETTIQDAIDSTRIGDDPTVRWTILIYAATYAEQVTLNDKKENIDLVGVDRDAVIIAPSSGSGIKITSGTESSRNNAIRNLTIKPTDGVGVEIVQGGGGSSVPKDILIDGATIVAGATGVTDRHGILAKEVENLSISNCFITAVKGHGLLLDDNGETAPKNITITNCTITGDDSSKYGIDAADADGVTITNSTVTSDDAAGIVPGDDLVVVGSTVTGQTDGLNNTGTISGLRITRSTIRGTTGGGFKSTTGTITDTAIENARILGQDFGLHVEKVVAPFTVTSTDIIADGSDNTNAIYALRHDTASSEAAVVALERCFIQAINAEVGGAWAIDADNGDEDVRLTECRLVAQSTKASSTTGPAIGINYQSTSDPGVTMINGSIDTSSTGTKETEVWDIFSSRTSPNIFVTGVAFSKWRGKIRPAERASSVLQRMVKVDDESGNSIRGTITLTGSEQTITTGITDPDAYRTLQIVGDGTWSSSSDVFVVGEDWAGQKIIEKFTLNGTDPTVEGNKPFRSVSSIIAEAGPGGSPTITVGTTNKLGLYTPLALTSDVLQWTKLNTTSGRYEVQTTALTIDADYATVEPGSIGTDDSFGFLVLTAD